MSRKKVWGDIDAKAALRTLDRFTQDEARSRAAEILQVVQGLVQIMRAAMGGEQPFSVNHPLFAKGLSL